MFSSKRYDESTGLSYYGYRFYNPAIGRWMTRDPLGEAGGINLYGFVGNNPVNFIDPYGFWLQDVHSGIGNPDYGTYQWALDMGMSNSDATMLAEANNATDKWGNPAPVFGVPGRHFDTAAGSMDTRDIFSKFDLDRAIELYKQGNKCGALRALGRGLHSVQDKIAHGDWVPLKKHPDWYDDPSVRPDALAITEYMTKQYLHQFLKGISP